MKPRLLLPFLLSSIAALPAEAQLKAPDCKDLKQAQAINASFDADYSAKQDRVQQETAARLTRIDSKAKALIKAGAWTSEERYAYFGKVRSSGAYQALERKKTEPLFAVQLGRSTAPGIRDTNPTGACSYALSTLAALDDIQSITDSEYAMIEKGEDEVAADKKVNLAP